MSLGRDGQLEYKLLTRDQVEAALRIQQETMYQENIAIGVGMFEEDGKHEEMILVFTEVIKNGATLVAVDEKTNELAAVAFNMIHAKPRRGEKEELEIFIEENLKNRACRDLVKFLDDVSVARLLAELPRLDEMSAAIYQVQSSVDIFERYNAEGAMELFYLGTNPRYQGRGIGHQIVQKCIEFGRGLLNGTMKRTSIDGSVVADNHVLPQIIYGVFASNYSQKIADNAGFESVHQVRYDDYAYGGVKMSQRIGSVHKTAKLQVLKL